MLVTNESVSDCNNLILEPGSSRVLETQTLQSFFRASSPIDKIARIDQIRETKDTRCRKQEFWHKIETNRGILAKEPEAHVL